MQKLFWVLIVGVLLSCGVGCSTTSWADFGANQDGDVVGAPPATLLRPTVRATGVSSQAREIESRLNYH